MNNKFFQKAKSLITISIFIILGQVLQTHIFAATVAPSLNTDGISHIRWQFKDSTSDNPNGWHTGSPGNQEGQMDHNGSDRYALDWNNSNFNDCGQPIYAPFKGNIIYNNRDETSVGDYGYQIIIESKENSNFAFRAAHMKKGTLTSETNVKVGDIIGQVGSTGKATGCHLHSVLYQRILENDTNGKPAINKLRKGKAIGSNTGVATKFAAHFKNDGLPLVDGMTFDSHVNYADGTSIQVNTNFTKTWKLKNTGTTTWTTGYKVAYVSGNQMSGPSSVNLTGNVAPGGTINVSVNLKSPPNTGTKTGHWELRNAGGAKIGNTFQVSINATPVPTSPCQTFVNANAVLFGAPQCLSQLNVLGVGFANLTTSNNLVKSMYVPSGKSVRIYDLPERGGATRCIKNTMYNLAADTYDNGTPIVNMGLGTISSLEVYNNTNCTPPASACPGYSSSNVVLFDDRDCRGETKSFASTLNGELRNLNDYSFEDRTSSIYIPSGKSIRVYEHGNKGGSSRCINNVLYDLSKDYYTSGNTGLNMNNSISSFELFLNSNCTIPSNCPTYSSTNVVLFDDPECKGETKSFASAMFRNLSEYSFGDRPSSIYVPSGKSIRVYEHADRGGSSRCINNVLYNLSKDYYTSGNTGLNMNNNISSFELFLNSNCTPTSNCPGYSAQGVVPFADYECKGAVQYYYSSGWANLDLHNNNTRSLYVPSGKSVRLYEGSNLTGATKCVNTTLYDMRNDYYEGTSTRLVGTDGSANLSSLHVFNNSNCTETNTHCQNYNGNYVTLFEDTTCYGNRRYFVNSGFWNLPVTNFNDKVSSIYIPSGKSIKVFEHDNRGGSWSCYNTRSLWDLNQDWYQHGNTSLRLNNTISSIQVYNNTSCQ